MLAIIYMPFFQETNLFKNRQKDLPSYKELRPATEPLDSRNVKRLQVYEDRKLGKNWEADSQHQLRARNPNEQSLRRPSKYFI
ncbi:hypothetical protein V5799_017647 [Amblyomma americanum]|uniref:Uncharacterized protein n=1 Tax=Amblyomma americanum TaxID=6943 RepID=A0AAQ4F2N8_AMBAM